MPKEKGKPKRKWPEKHTEEYCEKRNQNNVAVKKSREKARIKQQETKERVDGLKRDNSELEVKVTTLQKELAVLKDLFTAHASGNAVASVAQGGTAEDSAPSQAKDPVSLDHVYSNVSPPSNNTIIVTQPTNLPIATNIIYKSDSPIS